MLYSTISGKRWLLSFAIASAFSFNAMAQSVSCAGVPAWNASTVYNPGDKMVYQGRLYEAAIPIWNAARCWACSTASIWTGNTRTPAA